MESLLSEVLLDKTIGVVIVEPTMSIAGTVRRVLLETGYSSVFIAHSVLDAFNTLSNNTIGWMIVSPLLEEKLTQWHCLRLPLEVQACSNVMVSILVNADQLGGFEDYYAFGALSIHSRQLTYNSFHEEFNQLLDRLRTNATVAEAVAADVRDRLIRAQNWVKLEQFEDSVLAGVDKSVKQCLRLIDARFKNGSKLEAMLDIKTTLQAHPELAPDIKALCQTYLGTSDVQSFRGQVPLSSVLVLDPDASQQQFLRTTLTEMGAEIIVCCDTLEAACDALHVGQIYDLIVTEWKLHKVEGHAFIQHVRHHGHENQPVLVFSSLVKPEDMALISEIHGVFIITKPSAKKQFKVALTEILERWNYPQEGLDQEDKIVNSAASGKLSQAQKLNAVFQANKKIERQRKDYVKATLTFYEGRYQEAKDIVLASAKQGTPSYKEISLLGKILLRMGDSVTALKFLEQANQMVPGNIERMCNLADASTEVGKPERGLQFASEAKKIGGDIGMVQSVYAKHAVANGMLDEASHYLESESTAREMIAFMNNLGIAHATSQKWVESDTAYQNALKSLDGRHPVLQALVSYNLGLSLVRQNKLKDAMAHLKLAESQGEALVKRKAADLRDRVEKSMTSKQPLVLKEVLREVVAPRASVANTQFQTYEGKAKAGVHGLFRVLHCQGIVLGMDLTSELPKHITKKDHETGVV
ncbi:MAG: response regulator [Oligoflexus sp.]|nr:response regulator [Oligoflexus sp.]